MYIHRTLEQHLLQVNRQYPVLMVCGARQVGKSTMLYHLRKPNREYVTLDDFQERHLAQTDPALFLQTHKPPLIIDEFQYAPDLLSEIKRIIDERKLSGKNAAGMYWLTGSQQFRMMRDISESLAGRVAIFDLSSFSAREINGKASLPFVPEISQIKKRGKDVSLKDVHQVYEYIFRGGMPGIIADGMERDQYYSDYIRTYLERDIHDLSQVGKTDDFYRMLVFLAARTAQELKYQDIASAIGVSAPTVKTWVSILEASGIVYILRPYYSTLSKRLVKTPKLYFMDTGLCAYLCRWSSAELLQNGAMDGAFLETYVVSEIVKSYYHAGRRTDSIYYYRDVDKREIDLIIEDGKRIYPIEIKKSANPVHADKNFSVLRKISDDVQPGLVICLVEKLLPAHNDCWYCPVWYI